jgi:hypothetical protein
VSMPRSLSLAMSAACCSASDMAALARAREMRNPPIADFSFHNNNKQQHTTTFVGQRVFLSPFKRTALLMSAAKIFHALASLVVLAHAVDVSVQACIFPIVS